MRGGRAPETRRRPWRAAVAAVAGAATASGAISESVSLAPRLGLFSRDFLSSRPSFRGTKYMAVCVECGGREGRRGKLLLRWTATGPRSRPANSKDAAAHPLFPETRVKSWALSSEESALQVRPILGE